MDESNTRDLAVEARTKIDAHVQDCIKWREVVQKSFSDLQADLKTLNTRVILILGGLIALSKALEFVPGLAHITKKVAETAGGG